MGTKFAALAIAAVVSLGDSFVSGVGADPQRAAGAEYGDLQHALDGHQLCDRRATVEWVRPLRFAPWSLRESLHPDARGQRAIGACIALHFSRPRGDYACRSPVGGADADGMRLERLETS